MSGLRGRMGGGGIGFVTELREGVTRFLGKKSDMTGSTEGEIPEVGINDIEFAIERISELQRVIQVG